MMISKTIELDLLIVGGGLQGLTLLHQFAEELGGSAVLVSRDPLGHGETLHSHGYLHRGYSLPPDEASLIPDFVESFDWWTNWMRRHRIHYEEAASVLFDLSEKQYEATTRIWTEAGLAFEGVSDLPAALRGGVYSRPNRRRLVRIHDRLIPAWRIVEELSAPLMNLLMQGALKDLSWDPGTNRIVECRVSTAEAEICFRPKFVVLATGRDTQSQLRKITGPDRTHPFRESQKNQHLIRDVPMILIKGASLPSLSGWFFLDAPVTLMTHPLENGERMWVVTLMEGHPTSREDFEDKTADVKADVIHRTLRSLWNMIPSLNESSGQLRFSSYSGAKIDHPEGPRTWFIGDAGIKNLRFVWPVLWGLSYSASRRLVQQLSEDASLDPSSSRGDKGFDAEGLPVSTGVEVGEEKRLSTTLRWQTLEEWKSIYRFSL
jgi:2-polyprenyl-6-methoxyphenol hydroxylase-like FAD-dependent oxidoreductase